MSFGIMVTRLAWMAHKLVSMRIKKSMEGNNAQLPCVSIYMSLSINNEYLRRVQPSRLQQPLGWPEPPKIGSGGPPCTPGRFRAPDVGRADGGSGVPSTFGSGGSREVQRCLGGSGEASSRRQ